MDLKFFVIALHIISSIGCLLIFSKYHFDDYVMNNWMDKKNYILSDLFALLLACLPVVNYCIVVFFVMFKIFDGFMVFTPERRKRFDNNISNMVLNLLENTGQSVIYPIVAIIGVCGWIYGISLAGNIFRSFFCLFPAFAWAQVIFTVF